MIRLLYIFYKCLLHHIPLKKKEHLKDKVKKGRGCLSQDSISDHYTKGLPSVKFVRKIYVYATTNLSGWNETPEVYFLN